MSRTCVSMTLFQRTVSKKIFLVVALFLLLVNLAPLSLYAQVFSSEQTFRAAITAFKEKNYYSARLLFQEILHKDPTGEHGDDAQYYNALTYFYEGEYRSAIFEMRLVIRDYPVSPFVPRAYFFTGESYFYLKDYKTALESHHAFVRRYPEHPLAPDALHTTGFIFLEQKRYEEAISEFRRILDKYPDARVAPSAALQLGIAYYNIRDYTAARREFAGLLIKYPQTELADQAQFWAGKSYFAEDRLDDAEREFLSVLEKHPDSESAPEALYFIALCQHKKENFTAAAARLEEILRRYPNYKGIAAVYFRLGQILAAQEQHDEALVKLNPILKKHKESEFYLPALELTGDLLRKKGNAEQALALYVAAEKDSGVPNNVKIGIIKKKADILYLDENFTAAAQEYERLAVEYPTDPRAPEALFMAAQSEFRSGWHKKAEARLDELIRKYPDDMWRGDAYYLKAEIAFSLKDYDAALQHYRRILRFYPKHKRAFDSAMGVGWCYFELKQYARAADEFRKLLEATKLPEEKIKARMAWAAAQFNLRDFEGAIANYEIIIKQVKDFPTDAEEALFQIGWVRYRQLEYEKAISAFEKYLKTYPEGRRNIEAQYFLAWSFSRKGDHAMAEKFFAELAAKQTDSQFKERATVDLGKVRITLKKYPEARLVLENFLVQYPDSSLTEEVLYSIGLIHARSGMPENLQETLERLKKVNPKSAYLGELGRELGDYYRRNGNFEKAHEIYATLQQQSPALSDRLEAQFARSQLYVEKKQFKEGIGMLANILDIKELEAEPFKIRAFLQTVQIYYEAAMYAEGLDFIRGNRAKLPRNSSALNDLALREAEMLILTGKYTDARKILQPLLSDADYNTPARYYMALAFYRDKMLGQAFDFFRQASAKSDHPLAGKAIYYTGEIYFERGEFDKAGREFARVSYLYSADAELYELSLYKAALSFKKAGQTKESDSYQKKLREAFPQSKYLGEL